MGDNYELINFSRIVPPPSAPSEKETPPVNPNASPLPTPVVSQPDKPEESTQLSKQECTSEFMQQQQIIRESIELNPKHPNIKRRKIRKVCYTVMASTFTLGICMILVGILLKYAF